ncbi:calpain-A-like [Aphidius gifuensis]|uniref:calpain-A-like n=1 Tax=Aphidius gifuensis TaxID=684658 RepID=UPI001CDBA6E8|nr:calpain-A-like [Aphidius gifuensis]
MQDLSGGISELYAIKFIPTNILFKYIHDAKTKSTMMSVITDNETHTTDFGLLRLHYYAIIDIQIATGISINHKFPLLHIYNPHGQSSKSYFGNIEQIFTKETIRSQLKINVDGESWILYDDFIKYFDFVDICNLTPNKMIGDVYTKSGGKKLSLSKITGKFMGAINSREITDSFIETNPQYRVVLTEPDHDNIECSILIGVSLKRRHDLEQVSKTPIHFHIILIDNDDDESTRVPKPLSSCGEKCNKLGPFVSIGLVSGRFNIKPGAFYIIPSVGETFKGATFHLQILSEHANILE